MAAGARGRSRDSPIRSARCSPNGRGPNGLRIQRVRVPLGVIGIIYESRPNVTADAGALCLKSGNAVILRGGSESARSNARHPRLPGRGSAGRRTAGRRIQLVPTTRSRGRRLHARRHGGLHRCDRAARRQEPGRSASGGGARAGDRASRGRLSRLCRPRGGPRHGAATSCSMPSCGAPESAAPPRRCWWTARRPPRICAPLVRPCSRPAARCAATRRPQRAMRGSSRPPRQDWYTDIWTPIIAVRVVDGVDAAIAHIRALRIPAHRSS